MAHTPGPWKADDYMSGHDGIYIRAKSRHWSIGVFHATDGCSDPLRDVSELETEANARLASAAPELLEALKEIESHGWTQECCSDDIASIQEIARSAIKKAEGR